MAKETISGKDVIFRVDGIIVGCATSINFTYTTDMTEATGCRDTNANGKYKEFKPGQNSWTGEAPDATRRLITGADTIGQRSFNDFKKIWKTQKLVELEWGTEFQEDEREVGYAYISNLSEGNPLDGESTWSVSFQGTGELTTEINPIVTPAAPAGPVTNNVAKTYNWTYVDGYPNPEDYEYTQDTGATYLPVVVKPAPVVGAKAAGVVGVRVKATLKNDPSTTLYNIDAFTA